MPFNLAFVLALAYNAALFIATRVEITIGDTMLRHHRAFHVGAFVGMFIVYGNVLLAIHAGGATLGLGEMATILMVAGALGLTLMPFLFFLLGEYTDVVRKAAMSEGNIKWEKTYDQSDAAVKQRDYARAETLLRDAIAEDPQHPEPHRRVAEVLLLRGDLRGCLREMKEAAGLTKEEEPKAVILLRIFDLLVEKANDREAAAAHARALLHGHPGTRLAEMAQARLDRLARTAPPVG